MSGDAGRGDSSSTLMDDFVSEDSKFNAMVKRLYGAEATSMGWGSTNDSYWLSQPSVKGKPLDSKLQDYIKSNAFDSQGSFYIVRNKVDDRFWHNLFDLSQTADLVYVGRIETTPSVGEYSMKRIYGVEGQVVHWSILAREYKGKGFGAFLYDTLLYKYGVLESDTILYEGSLAMWSKHLPKVATFFGGTIAYYADGTQSESQTAVVPLTSEDVKDKEFIRRLGSFVAFHNNVPAGVKQIANLTKGLSIRTETLGVVDVNLKIDTIAFDEWDEESGMDTSKEEQLSFLDAFDIVSYEELLYMIDRDDSGDINPATDNLAKAQKLLILFTNATVIVEPKGDGIKYELIK
jgi:hypothetical protein